jgi:hypothetical protein
LKIVSELNQRDSSYDDIVADVKVNAYDLTGTGSLHHSP